MHPVHIVHIRIRFFVNGGPTNFGVTLDEEGNLYGTTAQGGPGSSNGVIFKLTRQPDGTWTETNLYNFSDSSPESASFPSSGVVFDRDGNIYTTTFLGGVCAQSAPFPDCGTVIKLTPQVDGSWTPSVIHSFSRNEGNAFQTSLVFDAAGNLYGYTENGSGFSGNCCGVVYRLKPNSDGSWSADILYAFKGLNGGNGLVSRFRRERIWHDKRWRSWLRHCFPSWRR
jgi:beta-xylosidase